MTALETLFQNNKDWAAEVNAKDPEFFTNSAKGQSPTFLWIGCADSRVPQNVVTKLGPGEIFVHRNIANQVIHTDMNFLSVLQYSVEALKVSHILVCGHYGCGGVQAAMGDQPLGLIDNWLRHIKDVYAKHQDSLKDLDDDARFKRLCELNVIEQVRNVCHTGIVQGAWAAGQDLTVHGVIYGLDSGLITDLDTSISSKEQLDKVFTMAF